MQILLLYQNMVSLLYSGKLLCNRLVFRFLPSQGISICQALMPHLLKVILYIHGIPLHL